MIYAVANIVRDWGDADAVRILAACRGPMRPDCWGLNRRGLEQALRHAAELDVAG